MPGPGEEEFISPWCPQQPHSCVDIPQEDKPGSAFLILEMLWVWFLLSLSLHEELCQSLVRTGPLKPISGNVVPAEVPEIPLGASLTALLERGTHEAELLL